MLNNTRRNRTREYRYILALVLFLTLALGIALSCPPAAHAEGNETSYDYADDILGALDAGELNGLLSGLGQEQSDIFGGTDFVSVVKSVVSGEFSLDFSDLLSFILSLFGTSVSALLSLLVTVVAIAIVYSVLGAIKGGRSSESVSKVVHFAAMAAVIAVVGGATASMFALCADTLGSMSAQINTVLPLVLTLMAASGASSCASVFQPAVAVLSGGLFNLLSVVLIPMLIAAFVFGIVGNLTSEVKLGKTSEFFSGSVKWLFGTGFFLLSAFLAVQGITASVVDGISVRSAKFTIGKFVPVIGGYLSDGFNLVLSGSVLVKNALGYTTLVLLAVTILPVIVQIAVYSLCLKLAAAAVEPLGDKLMSDMLSSCSKTVSLTGGIMAGAAFLYFIFLLIVISSGNVIL